MKYNHMMDVCFTYESENEDPFKDQIEVQIDALQKRVTYLKRHQQDAYEAFGHSDSYEIEE